MRNLPNDTVSVTPRIGAVVVIHYGEHLRLLENLDSWSEADVDQTQLCLIDNNERSTVSEYVNQVNELQAPWFIVEESSNLGYLGGVESGLKTINGTGAALQSADFVIISNSDVKNVSDPATLLEKVRDDPTIGVIGPVITPSPAWIPSDLPLTRSAAGALIWGFTSLLPTRVLSSVVNSARSSATRTNPLAGVADQTMVHGSCFAIRVDVLAQYFALQHRPWMYGEEVLLGRVLRRMGLSFAIDENWQVSHPPKTFSPQISRRLARARARSLWMITRDRITERSQGRRIS